ncbi:MAG TPA: lysylphosphatidylglycerol synthase domain-containing protein, partial [Polyangiaceae bacterium]
FERALSALARVPSVRFRAILGRWRSEIVRTDETLSRFFHPSASSSRGKIFCFYLGAWLLEATETWVMLHALGSTVAWGDAVGIEALVMLARNVLVMLPGGLGVQELGYATLLVGVAGDLGVCAALALLKRARELLWVLVGFALLAWDRGSVRQRGGHRGVRAPLGLPTLSATEAFQVGE